MTDQQELFQQFQAENGMSPDDAWGHVQAWYAQGKLSEAQRGCEEIVKFFPTHPAVNLLAQIRSQSVFSASSATQNPVVNSQAVPVNNMITQPAQSPTPSNLADNSTIASSNSLNNQTSPPNSSINIPQSSSFNQTPNNISPSSVASMQSPSVTSSQQPQQQSKAVQAVNQVGEALAGSMQNAMSQFKQTQTPEAKEAARQAIAVYEQRIANAQGELTTNDERLFAALSYLWVLFLVPLLLKRNNLFCQFHARQGLFVFIFYWLFQTIIGNILAIILGSFIKWVIAILLFPLMIFFAYKAFSGSWIKIPIVYSLSLKIPE